jgi:hypothetical protein
MRPYAEIQRIDLAVTVVLVGQSGGIPIPEPRRPDHKNLQAEATTCRDPGSVDCSGVLFCGGQNVFSTVADFAGVCD